MTSLVQGLLRIREPRLGKETAPRHRRAPTDSGDEVLRMPVIRGIPSAFDVRRCVVAGVDKRGRKVGAFETALESKRRVEQRVAVFRDRGTPACSKLANMLDECSPNRPCGSLACARCARTRRIMYGASALKFLAAYDPENLRFITLINPGDAIAAEKLHTFDPRKFIHRTRRQLERAGISKIESFLIGGVDGEWDEGWQLYQPHLHAITRGVTKHDLKRLIASWDRHPERVRIRQLPKRIYDLPRIAAYLEKSWWPSMLRKNNPYEIHPHDKRRPPPDIEREVLHWLHRHKSADLRLLYGVKSYRGTLVKS